MELEISRDLREGDMAIQNWGLIDYEESLRRQTELVGLVRQELARETLIFCSHPAVVTLGRGTQSGDVTSWMGPTIEVSRGGRATYHGPSQIIVYPILDLNLRGRDLHRFFRQIEISIIETLSEFGIQAAGRSLQKQDDLEIEATGVWVGSRKIASIGIGVRKWISYHGLALNLDCDAEAFQGLKPCGFKSETMISIQEILGAKVNRLEIEKRLALNLLKNLSTAAESSFFLY